MLKGDIDGQKACPQEIRNKYTHKELSIQNNPLLINLASESEDDLVLCLFAFIR